VPGAALHLAQSRAPSGIGLPQRTHFAISLSPFPQSFRFSEMILPCSAEKVKKTRIRAARACGGCKTKESGLQKKVKFVAFFSCYFSFASLF